MTDSVKDQLAADLEQARAKGGTRVGRIAKIVQTAASQVFAEVKEGSGELGTIAKDRLSTAATTLNSPENTPESSSDNSSAGETPAAAAGEWTGSTFSNLIVSLLSAIKQRMSGLDAELAERYGDRYRSTKQRLDQTATWYRTTLEKAKATTPEPTPLERKQAELASTFAEAGATAANKEQQIRLQVQEMVKTATQEQ